MSSARKLPPSVLRLHRRIYAKCATVGRGQIRTVEEVINEYFDRFNADGSGKLPRIEFVKLLHEGFEVRAPHYEVANLMQLYDTSGVKRLDRAAFIRDVLAAPRGAGGDGTGATQRPASAAPSLASTTLSAKSAVPARNGAAAIPARPARALSRPTKAFLHRLLEEGRKRCGNGSGDGHDLASMERLRLACIQIFRGIDRDSSGALSLDELGPFMRRTLGMNVTDGVIRSVAEWLDSDGQGTLSFEELWEHAARFEMHEARGGGTRRAGAGAGTGSHLRPRPITAGGALANLAVTGTNPQYSSRLPGGAQLPVPAAVQQERAVDEFYNESFGTVSRLKRTNLTTEYNPVLCRRPGGAGAALPVQAQAQAQAQARPSSAMQETAHFQRQQVGGGKRAQRALIREPPQAVLSQSQSGRRQARRPTSAPVPHPLELTCAVKEDDAPPPGHIQSLVRGVAGIAAAERARQAGLGPVNTQPPPGPEPPQRISLERRLERFQKEWLSSTANIERKLQALERRVDHRGPRRARSSRTSQRSRRSRNSSGSSNRVALVPPLALATKAPQSEDNSGGTGPATSPGSAGRNGDGGVTSDGSAIVPIARPTTVAAAVERPNNKQRLKIDALARVQDALDKNHLRVIDVFRSHKFNKHIHGSAQDRLKSSKFGKRDSFSMPRSQQDSAHLITAEELSSFLLGLNGGKVVSPKEVRLIVHAIGPEADGHINVLKMAGLLQRARRLRNEQGDQGTALDRMSLAAARVKRDMRTARSTARRRVEQLAKSSSFRQAVIQPGPRTMGGAPPVRRVGGASYSQLYQPHS